MKYDRIPPFARSGYSPRETATIAIRFRPDRRDRSGEWGLSPRYWNARQMLEALYERSAVVFGPSRVDLMRAI
jgi:hypothetical protein